MPTSEIRSSTRKGARCVDAVSDSGGRDDAGRVATSTHPPTMSTYRAIRIEVEGVALNGRIERFTTTVIVSTEGRARGCHRDEALFRASVWGLEQPLRIVGEEVGMLVQPPARRYL